MDYLADRTNVVDASAIRRIWQMAATMSDPVDFSIGAPDFGPPDDVKAEAIKAIEQDHNGYTLTAGIDPLRSALGRGFSESFGWSDPQVLITSGLSGALLLLVMATVNAGDEVIMPDPYFVSYRHLVNLMGGKCVFVDTYPDFRLRSDAIEAAITDKTKLIMLNTPGNPTGAVLPESEVKAIADVARKHDVLVATDEIYWEFCYDEPPTSIASFYENSVVMRGFSKSYGVPGWRLGCVAVPDHLGELLNRMATLQQYTFVCAPHPFQIAAVKALDCDMSDQIAAYRRKRDLIYEGLKGDFEIVQPKGAFYAFVAAPGGDATAFVQEAIKKSVLVIPGSVFSQQDTHFRLSYATADSQIEKGVDRLCRLAKSMA